MSKIAKVCTMSKAMNQYLWPFLADFHRATPFHGRTHSKISVKNQMFCEMNGSICYYNKVISIYIQAKFMESYNKLVRDKIPEILDKKGVPYEKRIASDEEYKVELVKKLGEETEEFLKDNSPEELADVIEMIEALKKMTDYENVEEIRRKKLEERGGFDQKIILKGEK